MDMDVRLRGLHVVGERGAITNSHFNYLLEFLPTDSKQRKQNRKQSQKAERPRAPKKSRQSRQGRGLQEGKGIQRRNTNSMQDIHKQTRAYEIVKYM